MENKTAEEMALKKYPYIDGDVYRDAGNTCKREGFYAGYEAASLQCAEMKEENERLKERIEGYEFGEQFKDSPFTSTSHLIKEVSQLQEEVERLKSEYETLRAYRNTL